MKKRSSSTTYFHQDNGEGGMLTLIAKWIATQDLRTAVFKASDAWELNMLGFVYWSLFLRPDLALLSARDAIRLDRINAKYVN